jgi:hypothetical protein
MRVDRIDMSKACSMYFGTGKHFWSLCGNHFTLDMFHSCFMSEKKYVLFILRQQHMLNIAFSLHQDICRNSPYKDT